eukprot:TRINITY_DN4319_c1_g1_i2.p1 TRINITY_DN4319_c1_g1~~TRINITY_DN4319_c1_g1_i2.p1  ORF type:complete len:1190 (+),score=239.65 TRINITY_DN4319_c1_g1_i2:375-3944(+)
MAEETRLFGMRQDIDQEIRTLQANQRLWISRIEAHVAAAAAGTTVVGAEEFSQSTPSPVPTRAHAKKPRKKDSTRVLSDGETRKGDNCKSIYVGEGEKPEMVAVASEYESSSSNNDATQDEDEGKLARTRSADFAKKRYTTLQIFRGVPWKGEDKESKPSSVPNEPNRQDVRKIAAQEPSSSSISRRILPLWLSLDKQQTADQTAGGSVLASSVDGTTVSPRVSPRVKIAEQVETMEVGSTGSVVEAGGESSNRRYGIRESLSNKTHRLWSPRATPEKPVEVHLLAERLSPKLQFGTRENKKDRIVAEIFSTEATYIAGLRSLLELFVRPLERIANSAFSILGLEQIDSLFSDLDMLESLHKSFLSRLETADQIYQKTLQQDTLDARRKKQNKADIKKQKQRGSDIGPITPRSYKSAAMMNDKGTERHHSSSSLIGKELSLQSDGGMIPRRTSKSSMETPSDDASVSSRFDDTDDDTDPSPPVSGSAPASATQQDHQRIRKRRARSDPPRSDTLSTLQLGGSSDAAPEDQTAVVTSPTAEILETVRAGIADVFTEAAEEFEEPYSRYIKSYPDKLALLTKLRQDNPNFVAFCESPEICDRIGRDGLSNLLVTPVQRLPRYLLFLRELVALSPSNARFAAALDRMHNLVESTERTLKRQENADTALHGIKYADFLLDKQHQLIKVGTVARRGSKKDYKKRVVCLFLFEDKLLETSEKGHDSSKYKAIFRKPKKSVSTGSELDPSREDDVWMEKLHRRNRSKGHRHSTGFVLRAVYNLADVKAATVSPKRPHRFSIVCDRVVYYGKNKSASSNLAEPSAYIDEYSSSSSSFPLLALSAREGTSNNVYKFKAENEEISADWVKLIQSLLTDQQQQQPEPQQVVPLYRSEPIINYATRRDKEKTKKVKAKSYSSRKFSSKHKELAAEPKPAKEEVEKLREKERDKEREQERILDASVPLAQAAASLPEEASSWLRMSVPKDNQPQEEKAFFATVEKKGRRASYEDGAQNAKKDKIKRNNRFLGSLSLDRSKGAAIVRNKEAIASSATTGSSIVAYSDDYNVDSDAVASMNFLPPGVDPRQLSPASIKRHMRDVKAGKRVGSGSMILWRVAPGPASRGKERKALSAPRSQSSSTVATSSGIVTSSSTTTDAHTPTTATAAAPIAIPTPASSSKKDSSSRLKNTVHKDKKRTNTK